MNVPNARPFAADHFSVEDVGREWGTERYAIAVIDDWTLHRECFIRALITQSREVDVAGFASVGEWQAARERYEGFDAILYSATTARPRTEPVREALVRLVEAAAPTPVIVLAESDDFGTIMEPLAYGVRGCIPASLNLNVLIEAIRVTASGGILLPTLCLQALGARVAAASPAAPPSGAAVALTARQAEVAEALQRGKSNKMIAHELGMCENTVKVHVRIIMKKLNVSNRTEAAFMLRPNGGDLPRGGAA